MLRHNNSSGTTIDAPMAIYKGGTTAPDFTLYDLGSLSAWGKQIIGNRENIITVNATTLLPQLIISDVKIREAIKRLPKNEKLKLYWSVCANLVSGYSAGLT